MNQFNSDIKNPVVKWAAEIVALEGQLLYAREQYEKARAEGSK